MEIGYGTGHSLVERVVSEPPAGVELSEKMCSIALHRLHAAGFDSRVAMTVAPIPPLPYTDGAFDAVSMSFVLEVFPIQQIRNVLLEIALVLRRGKRVCIVATAIIMEGKQDRLPERAHEWMRRRFPLDIDSARIDVAGLLRSIGFNSVRKLHVETSAIPVAIVCGQRVTCASNV